MHYDYSSHKYVFSIGENFRSLLPEVSPIINKHYNVCAVIGNSGILTGSRCGAQIEKFDFVFRCNFAPTEIFKKDVGRRTNMTTFNPSILEKYYNNLLTVQDRNNFFLSLKKLDGAILWIPAFFFHTSATVTRTLVDFFVEHQGQLKVKLAWPGNIMQYINKYEHCCTSTDTQYIYNTLAVTHHKYSDWIIQIRWAELHFSSLVQWFEITYHIVLFMHLQPYVLLLITHSFYLI